MKNPETVFRELGDLYEFYREIKKFKIKEKPVKQGSSSQSKRNELAESHTEYNRSQK